MCVCVCVRERERVRVCGGSRWSGCTDVCSVDGGGPPESEPTVRNLVEPGPLSIGQLLVLHGLLKPTGLLPEQTLPRGEVGALEEGVLQYALHPSQGLDHVCAVVVQVPQLPVMTLMSPPERILLQNLTRDSRTCLELATTHGA